LDIKPNSMYSLSEFVTGCFLRLGQGGFSYYTCILQVQEADIYRDGELSLNCCSTVLFDLLLDGCSLTLLGLVASSTSANAVHLVS